MAERHNPIIEFRRHPPKGEAERLSMTSVWRMGGLPRPDQVFDRANKI